MVNIRPAQPTEHRLITQLTLRSKAHWGYSAAFMAACLDELTTTAADICRADRHYWLAEAADTLLGYYALTPNTPQEHELALLFVEPKHIGQGIGRQLVEHACAQARAQGATSLLIQGDPNAAGFYRALGAVQIGQRASASIPGRDLPEFRITLGEQVGAYQCYG